jgi:hypothetical protein
VKSTVEEIRQRFDADVERFGVGLRYGRAFDPCGRALLRRRYGEYLTRRKQVASSRFAATTKLRLLGVGLLWAVLTVLFEVGLGRLVLGLPWDRISADYDRSRGGFLVLGLLFMAVSPLLAARIRGQRGRSVPRHR